MINTSHSFFSSHNGLSLTDMSDTFLCMRLNQLKGPTPRLLGMDDSQGMINVIPTLQITVAKAFTLARFISPLFCLKRR